MSKVNFKYLILSGLCAVFAVVAFLYVLFTGISGLTGGLVKADMPGAQEVQLVEAGSYTIFHEWTHAYPANVLVGGDEDARSMILTLTNPQGGEVSLSRATSNSTYAMGSREGYSMYTFEIAETGAYTLAGRYEDGSEARVMFTLANDFMGKIFKMVMMCFACTIFPAIPGIIFFVLALLPLVRKNSDKPGN
jgi:hypothetical protein